MSRVFLAMFDKVVYAQQQGGASIVPSLVVMGAIFIIFYFLLIRPQQKQQKKMQDMRDTLRKGDRVLTVGGIYGTVQGVSDDIVSLLIADKVKIEVAKNSIAGKREENKIIEKVNKREEDGER